MYKSCSAADDEYGPCACTHFVFLFFESAKKFWEIKIDTGVYVCVCVLYKWRACVSNLKFIRIPQSFRSVGRPTTTSNSGALNGHSYGTCIQASVPGEHTCCTAGSFLFHVRPTLVCRHPVVRTTTARAPRFYLLPFLFFRFFPRNHSNDTVYYIYVSVNASCICELVLQCLWKKYHNIQF